MNQPVLALVGPTASGKSALTLEIAPAIGAEVVSIDSALVYRDMDIGTDKPTSSQLEEVAHHMVDVVDPDTTLTVAQFQQMAREAISSIHARGKVALLVGGSGLYFRAVVDSLEIPATDPEVRARIDEEEASNEQLHTRLTELDPSASERIEVANRRRIVRALEVIEITGQPFSTFRTAWESFESIYDLRVAGLEVPRDELDRRIEDRVDRQIERGLEGEVRSLDSRGFRKSLTAPQALGYAQILNYLDGRVSLEEAVVAIKSRTRRFARRQFTWFKADPRITWFSADPAGAGEFLKGEA